MYGRRSYVTQEGIEKIKSELGKISIEIKETVGINYKNAMKWQERAIKNASPTD